MAAGRIFAAWSDEAWVNEGAAVRVSIVCFGNSDAPTMLDDARTTAVFSDLTGAGDELIWHADLTQARPLEQNAGVAFSGITKKGAFELPGSDARRMLGEGGNPNSMPNSDVLFPWKNGEAIVDRDPDKWIINFGEKSEIDSSLYVAPFSIVEKAVRPMRSKSSAKGERDYWWKLARRAPDMFKAIEGLSRFIVTPEVPARACPGSA